MSTTVVASRFGKQLAFASWAAPVALDEDALREVLSRHGLELLPGALGGNEMIAADGLSPVRAARLAEDLRGLGLTVRVVNKTGLTQSARVANALTVCILGVLFTLPLVPFVALTALAGEVPMLAAVVLAVPGLFFALNALLIAWRGGATLPIAGAVRDPDEQDVVARVVESLRGEVPDHVLASILERAQALEAEARLDPQGPVAAELAALAEDDAQRRRAEAADAARALREELRRARLAAAEVQGRK